MSFRHGALASVCELAFCPSSIRASGASVARIIFDVIREKIGQRIGAHTSPLPRAGFKT